MKQRFTASVWREGDWFVAQCLEAEALANLREALELHFEPPAATVAPQTHGIEVEIHDRALTS